VTNPRDLERRVSQTRNDVDSLFDLLRETTDKTTSIADVQQQHGSRLEQIEQTLAAQAASLERVLGRLERLQGTQLNQTDIMDSHTEILDSHTEKLNEIVALLRDRPES
jgi:predicted transcriptional regulator